MLKYLAAIALVFGLSFYVSIQYKQHAENPASQSQQPTNRPFTSSANNQPEAHIGQPEWNPPRWFRLFGWPEGVGVWGLFLTLVAIAEQTYQTRRAADAAKDATNAAYGSLHFAEVQVEMMKEKERARLDIEHGEALTLERLLTVWSIRSSIQIRNIGPSPAYIVQAYGELLLTEGEDAQFAKPTQSISLPKPFPPTDTAIDAELYFFPGLGSELAVDEIIGDLHSENKLMHMIGVIEYDTLNLRFRKEFGYTWRGFGSLRMLAALMPTRSETSTRQERMSNGYWAKSNLFDKPEYIISRQPDEDVPQIQIRTLPQVRT